MGGTIRPQLYRLPIKIFVTGCEAVNGKLPQKYKKLFLVTFVAVVVYVVLKYLLPLVLPFVFAYFICRLLYPAAKTVSQKLRVPKTLCCVVFVCGFALLILAVMIGGGWYLLTQIGRFSHNFEQTGAWLDDVWQRFSGLVSSVAGSTKEDLQSALCQWGENLIALIREKLPEAAAGAAVGAAKGIGTFFIVFVIAIVGAILLMKNKERISRQLSENLFAREITSLTSRICETSAGFFKCQVIIIAVIALVLSMGLKLSGSSYSVLFGIVIAVLDALPVIGSGTILLPWAVISLIDGRYIHSIVLVVLYILCTLIREFLEPRLMGSNLGINEFYMLMATFTGLSLFGVWGIFLGPLGMVMILEILRQLEIYYDENDGK